MLLINVKFQEEYKKLDALCKEMLGGEVGVTEYINQMDLTPLCDQSLIDSWHKDYKNLKHYRWVRNKLAHEVGALDEELCNKEDIAWLKDFSSRIKKGQDPFSAIEKAKKSKQKKEIKPKAKKEPKQKIKKEKPTKSSKGTNNAESTSLWAKFTNGIKNLLKL